MSKVNNLTEIVFILDKSGSMCGTTDDVIGSFNGFLKKQKKLKGKCLFTFILFDTIYNVVAEGKDVKEIAELTKETYVPSGMTALLDAMGRTIDAVDKRIKAAPRQDRPGKVVFAVLTDGFENSSLEYNSQQVKDLIKKQTDKKKWNFVFLSSDIRSSDAAKSTYGFSGSNTVNYMSSKSMMASGCLCLDSYCSTIRSATDNSLKAFNS